MGLPYLTHAALAELLDHLETVEVLSALDADKPFRMPVQWVNRPNLDFRGFSGLVATGSVKPGDAIRVLPSGKTSTVKSITTFDGELDEAVVAAVFEGFKPFKKQLLRDLVDADVERLLQVRIRRISSSYSYTRRTLVVFYLSSWKGAARRR